MRTYRGSCRRLIIGDDLSGVAAAGIEPVDAVAARKDGVLLFDRRADGSELKAYMGYRTYAGAAD